MSATTTPQTILRVCHMRLSSDGFPKGQSASHRSQPWTFRWSSIAVDKLCRPRGTLNLLPEVPSTKARARGAGLFSKRHRSAAPRARAPKRCGG
jgi:hypothetical protein